MEYCHPYSQDTTITEYIRTLTPADLEYRYGMAASSLLNLYFPTAMGFLVGPEPRLPHGTPDFGVVVSRPIPEGHGSRFEPYCYMEVKKASGSFNYAQDQLGLALRGAQNRPCYAIILVGKRLRFFLFNPDNPSFDYGGGMTPIGLGGNRQNVEWHLEDHQASIHQMFTFLATTQIWT